jgi:hypothetical protein
MKPGDLILIIAVIVSLALGVASIVQNNITRQKQSRSNLVNEVIDWATKILNCDIENPVLKEIAKVNDPLSGYRLAHAHIAEVRIQLSRQIIIDKENVK